MTDNFAPVNSRLPFPCRDSEFSGAFFMGIEKMKKYTVTFGPLTQHGVAAVLKKIGTSAPLKLVSAIAESKTNSQEPEKKRTTGYSRLAKVTDEMKLVMREMRARGNTTDQIAVEIGCSRQSVMRYSPKQPKDLFSRDEL